MNSKNITDTNSRLLTVLNGISQDVYNNQNVENRINEIVQENLISTGKITKYYPSLNKSEVLIDDTNKKVICKNLSFMGGDLMFLYTPVGDRSFCEKLKEPCVIPRGRLSCLVANINSGDDEYLMLGYYLRDDLVYYNPSKQGNFKILATGSINEYSLKFGMDGLKLVVNDKIEKKEIKGMDTIVTTEEYSKEEIDELLDDFKTSFKNELKVLVKEVLLEIKNEENNG